jgi:hypothetical protein
MVAGRYLAMMAAVTLAGCSGPKDCPDIPPAPVSVLVFNATTGKPIDDATVSDVSDDGHAFGCRPSMEPCPLPPMCPHYGVFDCGPPLPGNYTMTVTAIGYQTQEQRVEFVMGDCDVIGPDRLRFPMQPQ